MTIKIKEISELEGKDANRFAKKMFEKENKKYPEDYTIEERKLIKYIVLARLRQMPDNMRMSIG